MPTEGNPPPHRYPGLDALRGIAAIAVVCYHVLPPDVQTLSGFRIFSSGYLAVDLFFVLSGYVISHAYEAKLCDYLPINKFMAARFIRLQPVMAIGTLLGCSLAVLQRLQNADNAPGFFEIATSLPFNLLMLPNVIVPWGIFLFNPPAWSLFYEILANFVYALILRSSKKMVSSTKWVKFILSAICVIGFLGIIVSISTFGNIDRGVVLDDWPYALSRIGFGFTLGILIQRNYRRWMAHLPQLPTPFLMIACLALLAVDVSGNTRMIYDLIFVGLTAPLLVMLAAASSAQSRVNPAIQWLGTISYPLYAVHAPIKHAVTTFLDTLQGLHFSITAIALSIGTAWVIAKIDPILQRRLRQILNQSPSRHHPNATPPSAIAINR